MIPLRLLRIAAQRLEDAGTGNVLPNRDFGQAGDPDQGHAVGDAGIAVDRRSQESSVVLAGDAPPR